MARVEFVNRRVIRSCVSKDRSTHAHLKVISGAGGFTGALIGRELDWRNDGISKPRPKFLKPPTNLCRRSGWSAGSPTLQT